MSDWNSYCSESMQRVGDPEKLAPDTLNGVMTLDNAGDKTDHPGTRVRELIALACAVTTRCDGCIRALADK